MSLETAIVRFVESLEPASLRAFLMEFEGVSNGTPSPPTPEAERAWEDLLSEWSASCPDAPTDLLVRLVRSAALAAERIASKRGPEVDVVWTGPRTLVPLRQTQVVVDELIVGARKDLLLVSYVVHTMPNLIRRLARAMERGVRLSLLFERGSWYGGSLGFDAARAVREALPGVRLLTWSDPDGRVHVKAVVADEKAALVTSANLTGAALHRNMELGVLIKGGLAPQRIREHFDRLLAEGILVDVE